jgi:hypothetical protein
MHIHGWWLNSGGLPEGAYDVTSLFRAASIPGW